MTIWVYDNVINGPLKPIPRKSHYTFNLRDISKIFQGLCSANHSVTHKIVETAWMWIHENTRIYGDWLIDDTDWQWLKSILEKEIQNTLNIKNEDLYNAERIIFGDFMQGLEIEPRIY